MVGLDATCADGTLESASHCSCEDIFGDGGVVGGHGAVGGGVEHCAFVPDGCRDGELVSRSEQCVLTNGITTLTMPSFIPVTSRRRGQGGGGWPHRSGFRSRWCTSEHGSAFLQQPLCDITLRRVRIAATVIRTRSFALKQTGKPSNRPLAHPLRICSSDTSACAATNRAGGVCVY